MLKDEDISNDLSLLSQSLSKEFGKLGISDAANGGSVDEFYFLAPTVAKSPKYHKNFHPNLSPVVEISDDLGFKNFHAVFNRDGSADGKVVVNPLEENYFVDWNPSQTKAQIGKIYRIRVRIGEKVLGHMDVGVVPSNQTKALQDGIIPAVQGQNFRVAFRLEEKECPARIEVKPSEATVVIGGEQRYEAIVYNFYGEVLTDFEFLAVKWSIADGEIASIDQDGLAIGKSFGSTQVKAKSFDVEGTATLFVQEVETAPRPGKDIIVFNDMNVFDNSIGLVNPNNRLLVRNLINFETIGPRANGNSIWFDCGKDSRYPLACSFTDGIHTELKFLIQSLGFDLGIIDSSVNPLIDIPMDVKVLFLWLPRSPYLLNEINSLKKFAEQGGRIVFIGEFNLFYEEIGFRVQNHFLENMGSGMRNVGGNFACFDIERQIPLSSLRPHPITRDMIGATFACASKVLTGANDYPLVYDPFNREVLASVAQINTNPISQLTQFRIDPNNRTNSNPFENKQWPYPGVITD
ncbi:Ig-like domain-containing protein [Mariniradius saccharolyticus]|nr:Ig-like domain-containing protein [Mariniradius saccharolyticus]